MIISNEKSPLTEVGFEKDVLSNVPTLALLRDSGKKLPGKGRDLSCQEFNYGLIVPGEGMMGTSACGTMRCALTSLPAPLPPAIRALPSEQRNG